MKPLDEDLITQLAMKSDVLVTIEEGSKVTLFFIFEVPSHFCPSDVIFDQFRLISLPS